MIEPAEPPIYTFSQHHPFAAVVEPGATVTLRTLDAFGNRVTSPKQKISEVCPAPYVDPLTGPVVVRGAEPGDVLRVTIHEIEPDRDFAVTGLVPNFGGLTRTDRTALLHAPLPERTRIMPITGGHMHFSDRIRLPVRPFLGTIGVAPQLESISSLVPDRHGGNLDCIETCAGHTALFPVLVPGAHFFVGDAHACQGDGELSGVAAEVPARVRVTLDVTKAGPGTTIHWPRIESADALMAVGSARPLEDAARIAWHELIDWMHHGYGFDPLDAYELLGLAGTMRVGNMVDPNYTMVAKVAKRHLRG